MSNRNRYRKQVIAKANRGNAGRFQGVRILTKSEYDSNSVYWRREANAAKKIYWEFATDGAKAQKIEDAHLGDEQQSEMTWKEIAALYEKLVKLVW